MSVNLSSWMAVFIALSGLVGCAPKPAATQHFSGPGPIRATVTVGMAADLVRIIGGPEVDVIQLLGTGVDPHLYKPTSDDTRALTGADIIFFNGLMLEGKMAEALHRLADRKRSVAVAERLPKEVFPDSVETGEHQDPHVWMDVSLWSAVAQVVCDELCDYDPPHASDYRDRCRDLRVRLDALHRYGQQQIGCVPPEQRVLVTSHDAFRYFGRAYGIEVEAIQGISTESEAGLQRVNDLVDLLVKRKVQAVFVESSVPKESIEAIVRGAASRGAQVEIAAELYSDAMGESGTYAGTYIGMMDHNLTAIAHALGCPDVPANGFRSLQNRVSPQP